MIVTRAAPSIDVQVDLNVRHRYNRASIRTPRQPNAAASDGVATPAMIRTITPITTDTMGSTSVHSSFSRVDHGTKSIS